MVNVRFDIIIFLLSIALQIRRIPENIADNFLISNPLSSICIEFHYNKFVTETRKLEAAYHFEFSHTHKENWEGPRNFDFC